MATAAARNDFSQMGDDIFSTLIKESIRENYGPHGYAGINQKKIIGQGESLFIGRKENEILSVFTKSGGSCESMSFSLPQGIERKLVCEVSKRWRLVNIGYPNFGIINVSPPDWPEPGAKLIFRINLSLNAEASKTVVEIVDFTLYKKVY